MKDSNVKFITGVVNSYFASAAAAEDPNAVPVLNESYVARQMPDGQWRVQIQRFEPLSPNGETRALVDKVGVLMAISLAIRGVQESDEILDLPLMSFSEAFKKVKDNEVEPPAKSKDGNPLVLRQVRKPEDERTHWSRYPQLV